MQSRSAPPPINEHRLKRLTTWVRLTLVWAAAFAIALAAPGNASAFVARMRGYAGKLLTARALLRMPMPRRKTRAHAYMLRQQHAITTRRILGGRFRRAMRASGLIAQARAIAAVLANAEVWIARIMRRRLSRLARQIHVPANTTARDRTIAIATSAFTDTS